MERAIVEIESLRAQVAALTEEKARTDAAVADYLAHLARVTEERDAAIAELKKDTERMAVTIRTASSCMDAAENGRMEAVEARAEVTRLRAALERIAADSLMEEETPGGGLWILRTARHVARAALAPEGKAKP